MLSVDNVGSRYSEPDMTNEHTKHGALSESAQTDGDPSFAPDLGQYRKYLDGLDMSEEAKDKYLQTLWHAMSAFVDLAWNEDPVQAVLKARPKSAATTEGTRKVAEPRGRE